MPAEKRELRFLNVILATLTFILIAFIVGGRWYMDNSLCFGPLGCNAGFFGYDAWFHVVGGMTGAVLILRLNQIPRFHILRGRFAKSFIVFIALVALAAVIWEVLEFSHDHIPTARAFFNALPFSHANNATFQPTNRDTTGDVIFGIFGGALAALLVRYPDKGR